jgi:hypothetical protein
VLRDTAICVEQAYNNVEAGLRNVRGGTVKKLLFVAGAALAMAACSEAPTSPWSPGKTPSARPSFDDVLTCKSGYLVAYDEDGHPYCAPDPNGDAGQSGKVGPSTALPSSSGRP